MFNLFQKFREGLKKAAPTFTKAFGKLFAGRKLEAGSMEELEEALYTGDFGPETAQEILDEIQKAYAKDKELRGQDAARIGATVLERVLAGSEGRLPWLEVQAPPPAAPTPPPAEEKRGGLFGFGAKKKEEPKLAAPAPAAPSALPATAVKPEVIVLVGVNGSGKTTTTAKLGWLFSQRGKVPVLGACDTFRAAANEQIKVWSERLDLQLVASQHGADAAAVAYDAYAAAVSRARPLVLLDTAGRLHNKTNLMEELKKIKRVLQKQDPSAPHHCWLVLDGSIGSNSIEQAKVFHEAFGLTGLIITKLDGTSRGGALVGIYRQLKLPIYFVGLGEQPEDLQPFSAAAYARAIFGLEDES